MKTRAQNYTGLTFEGPASTPYVLNAFKEGILIETVDLWENNPIGKQVREAYLKESKRLQLKLKSLTTNI
jgi:hypothetical protein